MTRLKDLRPVTSPKAASLRFERETYRFTCRRDHKAKAFQRIALAIRSKIG
jgi:hypothetical protein